MSDPRKFRRLVQLYTRRYAWGMALRGFFSAVSIALAFAAVGLFLVEAGAPVPRALLFLAPPVLGFLVGLVFFWRHRGFGEALAWLDKEISGEQRFQAAWEALSSRGRLRDLVLRDGRRHLENAGPKPPRPEPAPSSVIGTILLLGLCLVIPIVGHPFRFFQDSELVVLDQGYVMESWADRWAAMAGEERAREDRELAERMRRLGSRLAEGELSEKDARKALNRLEDDIEIRQGELERGFAAQRLEEEFGVDKETAESFRMRTRRIPSQRLDLLRRRVLDSGSLDEETRRRLEEILGDPDLRDGVGDGTQEMIDEFVDALSEGRRGGGEWDEALDQTRKARENLDNGTGSEPGDDEESSEPALTENSRGDGTERESDLSLSDRKGFGEGDEGGFRENEKPGGSGRGTTPVPDELGGSREETRFFGGEMNLDGPVGEGRSWRTVVRAYTEEGETTSPDIPIDPVWRTEAEAVIRREAIPAGLRDYVESYFFALEEGR